ncbi:MAG: diaminopimelate epimerase [Planctomycetota bacterium]|jgi:diaminopimelate epimerase|nr:diaminopimelate epimerase [Planctomycetota bacterium]
MKFTKMHGIGNDYIYVNLFEETVNNPAEVAIKVSDRHFGIGGDGLILIGPSEKAPVQMRMFNADGSEAEMCGNGLRCVGKFVFDRKIVEGTSFPVETGAGVLNVEITPDDRGLAAAARINMGEPHLARGEIPMQGPADERAVKQRLQIRDREFEFTAVSMGNPHCVIFLEEDLDAFEIERYGPEIENHTLFPQRINVEFVTQQTENELCQRTWERGSAETLACGTGASAVCVAANLLGLCGRTTLIHLKGGDLHIKWSEEDNCIYKTGPATEVFSGEIQL